MLLDAVAVKVVMVGMEPEKVSWAEEPWVKVVTVGWAPEKVRPVEVVTLLVRLVIVKDWEPEIVWALVLKV